MTDTRTTGGSKWVPAPVQTLGSSFVNGVWLQPWEDVEWIRTYGLDGSVQVSGYTIKSRGLTIPQEESCDGK